MNRNLFRTTQFTFFPLFSPHKNQMQVSQTGSSDTFKCLLLACAFASLPLFLSWDNNSCTCTKQSICYNLEIQDWIKMSLYQKFICTNHPQSTPDALVAQLPSVSMHDGSLLAEAHMLCGLQWHRFRLSVKSSSEPQHSPVHSQ